MFWLGAIILNPEHAEAGSAVVLYRFHGVELDLANLLLHVDGRKRNCSSKAFELLQLLALRPGRLITRNELQDALWPGGQVISDEALTQLIFRARAAIEPYAHHIQTVRGKGLRLDGEVVATARPTLAPSVRSSENEPQAASVAPGESGSVQGTHVLPASDRSDHQALPGSRLRTGKIAILLIVLLMLGGVYLVSRPHIESVPQVIDEGYGLFAEDLSADWADTPAMVSAALKNEATGERERAVLLLQAVHEKDVRTAIPAMFLALWAQGEGKIDRADWWLEQSKVRLALSDSVYLKLLYDYTYAEIHGTPQQVIDQAGALLDIRPDAWRMHQARSHLMEFMGMRDAALQEIQQIRVTAYGNRKLESVIADRASFGDVEGAQAVLDNLGPASDPAAYAFLVGRIAWSRGDMKSAFESFDAAGNLAHESGRLDIYHRSLIYAGALEVLAGKDDDAIERLELARGVASNRSIIDEVDIALLLAQLHAEAGDVQRMNTELDRALAPGLDSLPDSMAMAAGLTAFRIRPYPAPGKPTNLIPEYQALWRGFAAYAAGQTDSALAALAESQLLGIHHSRMSDEARWLEWQLGQPVTAEASLDPPYPPLSRVALRRKIRNSEL